MQRLLWIIALACSLALFGCSDDPDTDPTDSGTSSQRDATANADATSSFPDASTSADAETFPDANGQADATAADLGVADAGGTALAGFGEACTGDTDCDPAVPVCRNFNQVGMVCTKTCISDGDCPSGSMGQRCNMMGVCRP
jgi:hypothetical protein